MAIVDFILQKKGGVGKSVTASLYQQALAEAEVPVIGVDTDPSNQSLAAYKGLNVTALDILNDEEDIDKALFDGLVESINSMPPEAHVIIDNGASSFPALRSYLKLTGAVELLGELGHEVRMHVVIAGGADLLHTCASLKSLAEDFPKTPLVPWLNPFNGDIVSDKGQPFTEFVISREHGHQYLAVVEIPSRCKMPMFRNDLQAHFARHQTFLEVLTAPYTSIIVQQRLKMFWDEAKLAMRKADIL